MTTVSAHVARQRLAELMELAFYRNEQVRIKRNKKPMVRIVGEPFMLAVEEIINRDKGLKDTLAIMLDNKLEKAILQSKKDWRAGKKIAIEKALE